MWLSPGGARLDMGGSDGTVATKGTVSADGVGGRENGNIDRGWGYRK
jgi:hypothetical protein